MADAEQHAPIIVAPSILSADFGRLSEELRPLHPVGELWAFTDEAAGSAI